MLSKEIIKGLKKQIIEGYTIKVTKYQGAENYNSIELYDEEELIDTVFDGEDFEETCTTKQDKEAQELKKELEKKLDIKIEIDACWF